MNNIIMNERNNPVITPKPIFAFIFAFLYMYENTIDKINHKNKNIQA
jgi:hypothetical protein